MTATVAESLLQMLERRWGIDGNPLYALQALALALRAGMVPPTWCATYFARAAGELLAGEPHGGVGKALGLAEPGRRSPWARVRRDDETIHLAAELRALLAERQRDGAPRFPSTTAALAELGARLDLDPSGLGRRLARLPGLRAYLADGAPPPSVRDALEAGSYAGDEDETPPARTSRAAGDTRR